MFPYELSVLTKKEKGWKIFFVQNKYFFIKFIDAPIESLYILKDFMLYIIC